MPLTQTESRPGVFASLRSHFRNARAIKSWRKGGSAGPPPHVLKQQVVREHGTRFGLKTFIETGTFKGDMINAVAGDFREIHSIELGRELFEDAGRRFAAFPQIHLHHGDSSVVLPKILGTLRSPALFWLDGHYSEGITALGKKNTPVVEELEAIYQHNATDHVVLIDDARLFVGLNDYPTLEELRRLVLGWSPGAQLEVSDDIIRLHGAKTAGSRRAT